jgi:hypothetical protein
VEQWGSWDLSLLRASLGDVHSLAALCLGTASFSSLGESPQAKRHSQGRTRVNHEVSGAHALRKSSHLGIPVQHPQLRVQLLEWCALGVSTTTYFSLCQLFSCIVVDVAQECGRTPPSQWWSSNSSPDISLSPGILPLGRSLQRAQSVLFLLSLLCVSLTLFFLANCLISLLPSLFLWCSLTYYGSSRERTTAYVLKGLLHIEFLFTGYQPHARFWETEMQDGHAVTKKLWHGDKLSPGTNPKTSQVTMMSRVKEETYIVF